MKTFDLGNEPEILATYDRDGYVAFEGFLDRETIAAALGKIADIREGRIGGIPDDRIYFEDPSDRSTLKQVQELFKWDKLFERLMFEGKARRLAEILLQDEAVGRNMQYFNKPPRVGQPTPPHQDGYYFMLKPCVAVTMWLALEPVDEETGCVRYLEGSHKAGIQPHERTQTIGFSQQVSDFDGLRASYPERAFPASPGTLLAHDARTVHFAGGNQSSSRTRQALGFIYYAKRAREDQVAHAAYQAKLAEDLRERGAL